MSTSRGKCIAARTAAEAIMTSSMSAMGMPARLAFFWASSSMMILGNAVSLGVVAVHVRPESEHVDSVEPSAVGVEEGHDVNSEYLCIKGICVLEVGVPSLVHRGEEEFGCAALGRFVAGIVVKSGTVGCFPADSDDGQRIFGNIFVVER